MIRTALEFIRKELETYIIAREDDPDYTGGAVELRSVVTLSGSLNVGEKTHVSVMLVNVEEERKEGKRSRFLPAENNQFHKLNPPVELDLFILFVAHNSDYETALRDLSDVISFFQSNTVFDQARYPLLNSSVTDGENKPWRMIERLSFRLHNLSFEQQNNLWGMFGSKYMPSVVYKMNMLTVFETRSRESAPGVTEVNLSEN